MFFTRRSSKADAMVPPTRLVGWLVGGQRRRLPRTDERHGAERRRHLASRPPSSRPWRGVSLRRAALMPRRALGHSPRWAPARAAAAICRQRRHRLTQHFRAAGSAPASLATSPRTDRRSLSLTHSRSVSRSVASHHAQ